MVLRQLGAGVLLASLIAPCSMASDSFPLSAALAKACAAGKRDAREGGAAGRYGVHFPNRTLTDDKLKVWLTVEETDCERITADTRFWVAHRIIEWEPRMRQTVSYVYKTTPRGELAQAWRVHYLDDGRDGELRVDVMERTADVKANFDYVVSAFVRLYGAPGER